MSGGSTPYPVIPPGVSEFREAGAEEAAGWQAPEASEVSLVPTHCCFCGVQCGMDLKVDGEGRVFGVEPRDHDINKGKLCPKGVTAYQQVDHPDRLLHPLVRDGRSGELRRASWEEALDRVAGEIRRIQDTYGRNAFGVYSGSSLVTENTYLMGKFARVALKTKHIDYNGRLCMVSAAAANKKAFGIDRAANPWRDMLSTQVVLLAGANVAECFPVMSHYVWGARDRGAKLIVVDPRETPLARTADLHVPLRPGTDAAFFSAVLHVIERERWIDEAFIAERTVGWDDVRETVAGWPPSRAAEICGIDAEVIELAARVWGTAERAMAFHARGIEHQIQGVENALSIINLVLATGQIGAEGKGYGTITGQGNGQGGREHGQKTDQLPGARDIENPEHRSFIADYWGIDEAELPHAGVSAVELVHLMESGEVRGFLALCNNPFVSMPNATRIERCYDELEFHVQIDFFLSETAARADVVLPCSAWAEEGGTTTNAEGRVILRHKAVEPPGEARPDWWIVGQIAERLGAGDRLSFGSIEEIFEELRGASKGGVADYSGITYERLEETGGLFWPVPSEDHPGTPRLFEERFNFPDGKARFNAVEWREPAEPVDAEYPMRLTTGRTVAHFLSGNQTRRIGALVEQTPRPWIEVHPSLGFAPGDPVRVSTRRGEITLPALVTETIREDTVFVPYHWAGAVAANLMTVDALHPVSRIPEYKVCAARIERGTEITPAPRPPNPSGAGVEEAESLTVTELRQPSAPQGRGTSDP
ncbi:MAG TPA: molybdopterin oxidoreductase family protein [Actinomycetota bacterium]